MNAFRCAACGTVHRSVAALADASDCHRCRRPVDRSGRPQRVDGAALAMALHAFPGPVLVQFSAAEPSPDLLHQAASLAGALLVLTVDPVAEPAAACTGSASPVPTLVLFDAGAEVGRLTGTTGWPGLDVALALPPAPGGAGRGAPAPGEAAGWASPGANH